MKLAIMQPYFFPYIGYFQLMKAVDEFVVYDNIQFTKKGWFNRNRILCNGKDIYITVPLKNDSDYLDVRDRRIADNWVGDRQKILRRISECYKKAPFYETAYPVIEKGVLFEEINLFSFIFNTINLVKEYLEINTTLLISSSININDKLKAEKKVIEISKARKARTYINSIGGIDLYNKSEFKNENIDLCFLKTRDIRYPQFKNDFISSLSIIDVMMFNSKEEVKKLLEWYDLR